MVLRAGPGGFSVWDQEQVFRDWMRRGYDDEQGGAFVSEPGPDPVRIHTHDTQHTHAFDFPKESYHHRSARGMVVVGEDSDLSARPEVRWSELPAMPMSGALIFGIVAGSFFGPIGGAVGFVLGGVAGEIYDRRTSSRTKSIKSRHHSN